MSCEDLATGRDIDRPDDLPGAARVTGLVASPADLTARLSSTGYLCDDALATVGFLSLELGRPLLLEGEPGTGKTALAEALAESLDLPLIRLQCYEGIDASQALYDWDFPRQILHLRAVESVLGAAADVEEVEKGLFSERFLLARPVLRALRESPAVLLIDEIDRADDEFEAFLLEVLSTYQVTIPELGTVAAVTPAGRRAHLQPHPRGARRAEAALPLPLDRPPRARARGGDRPLARPGGLRGARRAGRRAGAAAARHRPGQAARASRRPSTGRGRSTASARRTLDVETAARTLGAAIKHREDADRVRAALDRMLTP